MNRREFIKAGTTVAMAPAVLTRAQSPQVIDQWNTVEVIWQGDRAAHIVNGRTVNVATRLQQPDPQNPGQFIPLTRGKIAIEIEYAEIWFRRIEVKAI